MKRCSICGKQIPLTGTALETTWPGQSRTVIVRFFVGTHTDWCMGHAGEQPAPVQQREPVPQPFYDAFEDEV